jgi:prophage regulatory protein
MSSQLSCKLLRRTVVEDLTGLARSTIYARVSDGRFPKPVRTGPKAVRWPSHEIEALNRAAIAGADEQSIRALVVSMHAARREIAP